jgi:hypothetical protein
MKYNVMIRTGLGVLTESVVEAPHGVEALSAVLADPGVGAHLHDLRFGGFSAQVTVPKEELPYEVIASRTEERRAA